MKNLLLCSVLLVALIGCNEDTKTTDDSAKKNDDTKVTEAKAMYEKNLAALKANFASFEKEDIDGFAAGLADNMVWNGPSYGDTVTTKAHWLEGLKYYAENWDNIKFNNATFLPGIDSASHELDGSVRCYGSWDAVHKSGLTTHVNYYATADFNKDNKITSYSEFFDVGGLMNAVQKK
jgi:ketosteroid isomerase-like protein